MVAQWGLHRDKEPSMSTLQRTTDGWPCHKCRETFRTSTQLRGHQCAAAAAQRRCNQLRWPTQPVTDYLIGLYGVWQPTNTDGYSGKMVERLTGVPASTFHISVHQGLMDRHADKIAVALGVDPERFWPGWRNALDVTDDDRDWIEAWLAEGRVAS